jgi:hypothetical protein
MQYDERRVLRPVQPSGVAPVSSTLITAAYREVKPTANAQHLAGRSLVRAFLFTFAVREIHIRQSCSAHSVSNGCTRHEHSTHCTLLCVSQNPVNKKPKLEAGGNKMAATAGASAAAWHNSKQADELLGRAAPHQPAALDKAAVWRPAPQAPSAPAAVPIAANG